MRELEILRKLLKEFRDPRSRLRKKVLDIIVVNNAGGRGWHYWGESGIPESEAKSLFHQAQSSPPKILSSPPAYL